VKNINPDEIGYYGRPVTDLTKEELLELIAELCSILMESHYKVVEDKETLSIETYDQLH